MVTELFGFLILSPAEARLVGTVALAVLVVTDLITSADAVRGNTPREWLIWLTQWRSEGLWRGASRRSLSPERVWARRSPFNYLPLSGAGIALMVGALMGHFFHPGWGPLIGPAGFVGLVGCLLFAVVTSVGGFYGTFGRGEARVPWLTLAGFLAGVAIWPVGG